jgi:hypothetical protein
MFFYYLGIHKNIINVNDHELVQLLMEDGIHEGCECQWSITQPKWHHHELIQGISIRGLHKKLWVSKVAGVPILEISRLPTWECWDKMTFGRPSGQA